MNGASNRLLSKNLTTSSCPSLVMCSIPLDVLRFLGGTANLDSIPKAQKTSKTKIYFPYDYFNHRDKLNKKERPPNKALHNKVWNCKLLEKKCLRTTDYGNMICSGLTTEAVRSKWNSLKHRLIEQHRPHGETLGGGRKAVIPTLFALVQSQGLCSNIGACAELGRILSQQWSWYAQA